MKLIDIQKMIDKDQQLLVITMEECGEVIQACSKLLRRGHKDGSIKNNKKQMHDLQDEVGDLYCMIQLLIENGWIDKYLLEGRTLYKKAKLKKWSDIDV